MKKYKTNKIIRWIFSLWMIVLVGVMLLCFFLYKNTFEYINYSVGEFVNKSSMEISNKINDRLQLLENTSLKISNEMLNEPKLSVDYLKTLKEELGFKELSVASLDGTTYISNGNEVNLYERDYFQNALAGESSLGNLIYSRDNGELINVYSVPIYKGSEVVGVLWGSISADSLYKELELSSISRYGEVLVVDSETNFIVGENNTIGDISFFDYLLEHTDEDSMEKNQSSMFDMKKEMLTEQSGYQKFNYDNKSLYIYYNQLNVNDWWILLQVSTSTLNDFLGNQIKIVLIIAAGLFIIINIGFYQIVYKLSKLNKEIENQSFTDLVTNGKNDYYLKFNMESLLKKQKDPVLIGIKVENIDYLVKVLGLQAVDQKLNEFYTKVEEALNENEVVVHSFYGDFKVLKESKGLHSILHYIEQLNRINSDFHLLIGIYPIEKEQTDYNQMCSKITVARSNLKENYNYGFYSKDIHEKILQRNQLEFDILQAIKNNEFRAWFQPKYKNDGKTLVGAEALVRWYKEDQIIGPGYFVPLCEENNSIKEIDLLILEDVCKELKSWMQQGKKMVPISVNLSRNYFDQTDFIKQIVLIVDFYQIPPHYIEFEITETSVEGNKDNLKKIIDELHQKGFKVALDDFGVGYSSINTLVSMEFNTIKIDKVFVDGIGIEKWNNIIKYVISLAKQLSAKTVAEGVETKEQLDFLASNGCDFIQGYYLGKPMDVDQFEKLLD